MLASAMHRASSGSAARMGRADTEVSVATSNRETTADRVSSLSHKGQSLPKILASQVLSPAVSSHFMISILLRDVRFPGHFNCGLLARSLGQHA
jgi:hypothetical protein